MAFIPGTPGDDFLPGTPFDDVIVGDDGDDILLGLGGDDVLLGGDGQDELVGGAGNDTLDGGAGDDNLSGGAGNDILLGGDGGDSIVGGDGNDLIIGGAGDDWFEFGGAGDDQIFGGDGDDHMRGGAGVDSFAGGAGFDRVSFFHPDATQGAWADLRTQTIYDDGFGNSETMSSVEALGAGTLYADRFYGDDNHNLIWVGRGDVGYGFGGDDDFIIDEAPAVADGGSGVNTILNFSLIRLTPDSDADGVAEEDFATHGVTVDLGTGKILDDGFGGSGKIRHFQNLGGSDLNDTLTGDNGDNLLWGHLGDDTLNGDKGDDSLFGEDGNDTLDGGKGADRLDGGTGDDLLIGGRGADVFAFGPASGADRIADFENGTDRIEFSGIAGVDDFSDLTISLTAGQVQVSWDGGAESVILTGLSLSDVDPSDFLFA